MPASRRIKARGLLHPITTHDGLILDGRNRARACAAAGVELRCESYAGDDPVGFVIASNLHRRHLGESQRAMVAARLANLGHGQRKADRSIDLSQADAAARPNVGAASVKRAVAVRDRGTLALNEAVEQGRIAVSVAAKLAALPAEVQLDAVAKPDRAKHLAKQHGRTEREQLLGAKQLALPDLKVGVILEDYEWDYEVWSRDTSMDRHAANH